MLHLILFLLVIKSEIIIIDSLLLLSVSLTNTANNSLDLLDPLHKINKI